MRFQILGLALMASVAMPAAAQRTESIDRRVNRLEQEMRAVQRRVFPGSESPYVGPEIGGQPARPLDPAGVPATSAITDLTERVDALEGQLRELTGEVEQNSNRMRQMEEAFNRFRESAGSRLEALERPPAATPGPAPATEPSAEPGAADPPAGTTPAPDPAEAAYNAGFKLWEQKRYTDAQRTLEDAARRYPKSRWASWATNLAGRAYLDGGKPANAAKLFLSNYQANPKGERAADSLFFLGQALMALKKPADACKAYDELQDVYGETMRDYLKQRLPAARTAARCD